VAIAVVIKSAEFLSECDLAKCFVSQSSKPNELIFSTLFYDSVCLKDPHGWLIRVLHFECDDFEYYDVLVGYDVIESRDVIDDVTNRRDVGTFL